MSSFPTHSANNIYLQLIKYIESQDESFNSKTALLKFIKNRDHTNLSSMTHLDTWSNILSVILPSKGKFIKIEQRPRFDRPVGSCFLNAVEETVTSHSEVQVGWVLNLYPGWLCLTYHGWNKNVITGVHYDTTASQMTKGFIQIGWVSETVPKALFKKSNWEDLIVEKFYHRGDLNFIIGQEYLYEVKTGCGAEDNKDPPKIVNKIPISKMRIDKLDNLNDQQHALVFEQIKNTLFNKVIDMSELNSKMDTSSICKSI